MYLMRIHINVLPPRGNILPWREQRIPTSIEQLEVPQHPTLDMLERSHISQIPQLVDEQMGKHHLQQI